MPYAILRTAKLKTPGCIAGSLAHTFRTRQTPNADPARLDLNEHHGPTDPAGVREAIDARLPEKRRKDAVLCVEYFIGASPEFFQGGGDAAAYFARAVDWLRERHGAANVVSWSVHRDETSPHLVAYVVPIDGAGKLNAKHYLGGREKLSAMQTEFAARVGAPVGLQRGIEGSKATHTTIRQHYAGLERSAEKHGAVTPDLMTPRTVKRGMVLDTRETPEQVAGRLTRSIRRHYEPAVQRAAMADQQRKRADELAATAQAKAAEIDNLRALLRQEREELARLRSLYLDGLTPAQCLDLTDLAAIMREGNQVAITPAPKPAPRPAKRRPEPCVLDL